MNEIMCILNRKFKSSLKMLIEIVDLRVMSIVKLQVFLFFQKITIYTLVFL